MIQGVGRNGFAQAALEAALKSVSQQGGRVDEQVAQGFAALERGAGAAAPAPAFDSALAQGIEQSNQAVKAVEQLPLDLLSGKIGDFHEVAGQLKQAEIMFKFSLEVRNKLIDAYRETMRMSV